MSKRLSHLSAVLTGCIALALLTGCGKRAGSKIDWMLLRERFGPDTLTVPPGTESGPWMEGGIGTGSDPSQHGTVAFLLNVHGLLRRLIEEG